MGEVRLCNECGYEMERSIEDYQYLECGLDNVILRDVEVCRCDQCGFTEVDPASLPGIHTDIARNLLDKDGDLSFQEARFLCNYAVSRLEGWAYLNFIGEA